MLHLIWRKGGRTDGCWDGERLFQTSAFKPPLTVSAEYLPATIDLLSSYFPTSGGQVSHQAVKRLSWPPDTHRHTHTHAHTPESTGQPIKSEPSHPIQCCFKPLLLSVAFHAGFIAGLTKGYPWSLKTSVAAKAADTLKSQQWVFFKLMTIHPEGTWISQMYLISYPSNG